MSLRDTRDIGTAKIVMLGGGGGGGSYTAGSGISISNSVITNIRKGALTGVIDSVSTNIAHTQITGARDTFAAGALILLQSEAAGTADNLRIQYGAQASDSQTFAIYDTSGTAASVTIASGDTVIMMIDNTGYRAIILNVLSASGGSSYAGLGIGKKKTVTNNVIDTDIDLHRAPIVGDRLLIYFDATVQNPTGLTTYNNGTAVTSNLEPVTPMYINAGWNILKYENSFLGIGWVRVQNVPIPNNTLSGLSDTLIVSPSDGQMLAYDNSSSKWKNKTLQANASGTAVRELKTIQIGDNVFDTFGLKTYDVTSVTSGVNGAIAVDVITASQLNGEIIAIHTGSNTGSTGNAWTLALSDAQTVEALTMSKADGTAFTDALTANSLMFVKVNTSNDTAVVLGIVGAGSNVSANGSGSPVSYLNKLKIGSAIYDTSAIRPFSVSQIANNTVKIYVADIDQLDGKVIALSTGALTGSTSSAWSLNMVDTSSGAASLSVAMLNADGTAFTDDITANELLFVAVDLTNYEGVILSVIGKSEDEIKTATGNPITLTDAIAGNALEVSAEIVASQDLHGYDKPWAGGAGKNKLINNATTTTDHGVTFTVNSDGTITANGTATGGNAACVVNSTQKLTNGASYKLSGCPANSANKYRISITRGATASVNEDGSGATFTANDAALYIICVVFEGNNADNVVFKPMITTADTPDSDYTHYAPYENICPITGFSSVVITDVDAESHTATVTVSLGSTVYGGTLNLTTGELTIKFAGVTLTGAESETWTELPGYNFHQYIYATTDSSIYQSLAKNNMFQQITLDDRGTKTGVVPLSDKLYRFALCDSDILITSLSAWKTWLASNNIQLVYPLATPTTTTLTAEQVALVKGYNHLTCNSGNMSITYKASGLDALKERVDELEDRVDDLTVSDLADTAITTPTNGQVLTFDSVTGKWGNQNPSGGEVYFDQTATLSTSTTTTVTFTESEITTSSVIDIAVSEWGLTPEDVTVTTGVCTVIMPKVSTARSITVRIYVR